MTISYWKGMGWFSHGRQTGVMRPRADIALGLSRQSYRMYHVYKQVVRATLPQARIVVDRFHIQRMANDALEKLRKRIRKDLPARQRLKLKDERFRCSSGSTI